MAMVHTHLRPLAEMDHDYIVEHMRRGHGEVVAQGTKVTDVLNAHDKLHAEEEIDDDGEH